MITNKEDTSITLFLRRHYPVQVHESCAIVYAHTFNGYNLSLCFSEAISLTRHPTIVAKVGYFCHEDMKAQRSK